MAVQEALCLVKQCFNIGNIGLSEALQYRPTTFLEIEMFRPEFRLYLTLDLNVRLLEKCYRVQSSYFYDKQFRNIGACLFCFVLRSASNGNAGNYSSL